MNSEVSCTLTVHVIVIDATRPDKVSTKGGWGSTRYSHTHTWRRSYTTSQWSHSAMVSLVRMLARMTEGSSPGRGIPLALRVPLMGSAEGGSVWSEMFSGAPRNHGHLVWGKQHTQQAAPTFPIFPKIRRRFPASQNGPQYKKQNGPNPSAKTHA